MSLAFLEMVTLLGLLWAYKESRSSDRFDEIVLEIEFDRELDLS